MSDGRGGAGQKNRDDLMFGRYRKCRVPMKVFEKSGGGCRKGRLKNFVKESTGAQYRTKTQVRLTKSALDPPPLETVGIAFSSLKNLTS